MSWLLDAKVDTCVVEVVVLVRIVVVCGQLRARARAQLGPVDGGGGGAVCAEVRPGEERQQQQGLGQDRRGCEEARVRGHLQRGGGPWQLCVTEATAACVWWLAQSAHTRQQ